MPDEGHHVGDWKFGDGVRIEEHTDDIAKVPKRFQSSDVQILLRERYEQAYGIYDHRGNPNDHFALVRHHWCEDAVTSGRARERFEAFLDARVYQNTGIPWDRWIEQPSYMCDMQLEILEKRAPHENREITNLANEIRDSIK